MTDLRRKIWSNIMLIIAAAIWGSNFVFQKIVATEIGPFTFMAGRSFLGATTILLLILFFSYKKKINAPVGEKFDVKHDKAYYTRLVKLAIFCGCINVSGSVLVQFGLIYTSASKAGFLNAIYIIFVPILGILFFHEKSNRHIWAGILLAVIGLYNLCAKGTVLLQMGDAIILASTLCFALHIQLMSKYVKELNGMHLACLEFFCASIYCSIMAIIFENPSLSQLMHCANSILFAGILGIGICYALQVTAQKYTNPSIAALLMSLEAIFSALGGVFFLGESFTIREFIGIFAITTAVIIAQFPSKVEKK